MCYWENRDVFKRTWRWEAVILWSLHVRPVTLYLISVHMHASVYFNPFRCFWESVCSCPYGEGGSVGGGGGCRLHKCMAADMFVSATMRHIQHMLPSSSPFRGRLSRDTQQDSLTWSRGTTRSMVPQGPQDRERVPDVFVSLLTVDSVVVECSTQVNMCHRRRWRFFFQLVEWSPMFVPNDTQ